MSSVDTQEMYYIQFDQGRMGQARRNPTGLDWMVLEAAGQQMKCLETWTAACKLQGLGQNGLQDLLQLLLKRFGSDTTWRSRR
jgi:hypothetical protein